MFVLWGEIFPRYSMPFYLNNARLTLVFSPFCFRQWFSFIPFALSTGYTQPAPWRFQMIAFVIPYYHPVIKAMKGKNLSAMRTSLPFYSVHYNPVLWLPFNHLARKALMCAISPAVSYRPLAALGEVGAIRSGGCLIYIHNRILLNVNPATVLLPGRLCWWRQLSCIIYWCEL